MLVNIVLSMIAIYLALGLFVTAYITYLIIKIFREIKPQNSK